MIASLPRRAVIAHRGASAYAPEHSFAAYDLALAQGADALELDVRPLADGTLVVCHDASLARTCDDPRRLTELTPACLSHLDPDVRPRTLDAVLDRYAGYTRFLIELKQPRRADLVAVRDAIVRAGVGADTAVQSFEHGMLRDLHELDAELELCALFPSAVPRRLLLAALPRTATWATATAVPAGTADAAVFAKAQNCGLPVYTYTVNDVEAGSRLLAGGAAGLITDTPDVMAGARAGVALAA